MKKTLIIMALVASALSLTMAEPLKVGIMGGINATSLTRMNAPLTYADCAIGAQLRVSPLISVRPSVILDAQIEKSEDLLHGVSEYTSMKQSTIGGQIDVPLSFLRFPNVSLYAGPSVGYIGVSVDSYATTYLQAQEDYSILLLGAVAGAQYQFSDRFSAFLDLGLAYRSQGYEKQELNASGAIIAHMKSHLDDFAFRGATLGFIVYVK